MMIEQPPVPFEDLLTEGMPSKLIRNEKGDGMSVEWNKYSTMEDTQTRNGLKSEYGVVFFNVGEIREERFNFDIDRVESLKVEHDPRAYQSHTLITNIPSQNGHDYKEKLGVLNLIRLYLQDISHWGLIDEKDFYNVAKDVLKKSTSKKIKEKILLWIDYLRG